jgi:hypothetical protein
MTKRPSPYRKLPTPKEKLFRWRIARIKPTPAVEIGTVEAPDAIGTVEAPDVDTAIKVAIRTYGIDNPEHQKRLVAWRIG